MLTDLAVILLRGPAVALAVLLSACGGDGSTSTESTDADTSAGTGTGGSTTKGPTTDAPTTGAAPTGTSTGTSEVDGATDATATATGAVDPTTGGSTGDSATTTTGDSTGDGPPDVVPVLPSAGCGRGGAPTGHLAGLKTSVDGVDRSYDMFVPEPYDGDRAHAVIFAYHGVGGTANTNLLKLDTFSAANDGYSINVAPQGWPTAEWSENHFVPFNLDASLVVFDQVLDELAAEYCVDLNRVYATGHSNGGQMAFHLGCLRADRVRAVFPYGGRCFSYGPGICDPYSDAADQCNGEVMVMSVMGEDDVERHADEEATLAGFVARHGCDAAKEPAAPSPCLRFTGCDAGHEVTTCRIPGLGHQIWKDGLDDVYGVMMSL